MHAPGAAAGARWCVAGAAAGLAGGLYAAFSKGSVFPTYISASGRSVDALLMVLLGGVQSMAGPVVGALVYTGLFDILLLVDRSVAAGAGGWPSSLLVLIVPRRASPAPPIACGCADAKRDHSGGLTSSVQVVSAAWQAVAGGVSFAVSRPARCWR